VARLQRCPRDQDEQRVGHEDHQRHLDIDGQHHADGGDVEDRRLHDVEQPDAQEQPYGVDVVDAAAHDVAGPPLVVEGLRQSLQVREDIVADLVLDLARRVEDEGPGEEAHDRARQRDGREPDDGPADLVPGLAPVDERDGVAHQAWNRHEGGNVGQRRGQPHGVVAAVAADVPRQAAQRRAQRRNPGFRSGGGGGRAHRRTQRAMRSRSTPSVHAPAASQWSAIVRHTPFAR
jgi:hypothetical protein